MKNFVLMFMLMLCVSASAMGQEAVPGDSVLGLIASLETKMASIEGRVDKVTTSVGQLETSLTAGLEEQKTQLAAIEALKQQQQQLNERTTQIRAQADEALTTADRQAQQIAGLNGQVAGLQNQAQQLQGQAAEARQQAAANYQMAVNASAQAQQALNGANAADRAARPNIIGKAIAFLIPPLRHR
jgi:chromosome segregation ATPase